MKAKFCCRNCGVPIDEVLVHTENRLGWEIDVREAVKYMPRKKKLIFYTDTNAHITQLAPEEVRAYADVMCPECGKYPFGDLLWKEEYLDCVPAWGNCSAYRITYDLEEVK